MSRLSLVTLALWLAPASLLAQPSAAELLQPAVGSNRGPASVTLIQNDCSDASYAGDEFATLLRIELQALGISELEVRDAASDNEAHAPGIAIVYMRCQSAAGAGYVSVELVDLATGKRVLRDLLVTDLEPEARPRALSIAVALMIENSWRELATHAAGDSELPDSVRAALRRRLLRALDQDRQEPTTIKSTPLNMARDDEPRASMLLIPTARAFPARGTALLGSDLGYLAVLGAARVLLDAEVLVGSQEISDQAGLIAHMQLYWLNAGLSALWSSSTQPEIMLGPFVRVGYALSNASQVRGGVHDDSGGGLTAALGLSALVRAKASENLDLWAGFDVGYVTSGVLFLADHNRSAGIADITTALRAGIGFRL